jgi:hypothetical protein
MMNFYREHAPNKINQVDRLLDKYEGNYEEMIVSLFLKYQVPLPTIDDQRLTLSLGGELPPVDENEDHENAVLWDGRWGAGGPGGPSPIGNEAPSGASRPMCSPVDSAYTQSQSVQDFMGAVLEQSMFEGGGISLVEGENSMGEGEYSEGECSLGKPGDHLILSSASIETSSAQKRSQDGKNSAPFYSSDEESKQSLQSLEQSLQKSLEQSLELSCIRGDGAVGAGSICNRGKAAAKAEASKLTDADAERGAELPADTASKPILQAATASALVSAMAGTELVRDPPTTYAAGALKAACDAGVEGGVEGGVVDSSDAAATSELWSYIVGLCGESRLETQEAHQRPGQRRFEYDAEVGRNFDTDVADVQRSTAGKAPGRGGVAFCLLRCS